MREGKLGREKRRVGEGKVKEKMRGRGVERDVRRKIRDERI